MKALSKFNITILLSMFVALPISNSIGNITKTVKVKYQVLHTFNGDANGSNPMSALIQGSDGNFYGTTDFTVFKITPQGVTTLFYSFDGPNPDGSSPNQLIQGSDGNFYGTSAYGGYGYCNYGNGNVGCGIVFKITPQGQETILYNFAGGYNDGSSPYAGLIQGSDGNLYGTTQWDGSIYNFGIVFKITPQGKETILHRFTTGAKPNKLIQGSDGNFYGTTSGGGADYGTIFKLSIK